MKRLNYLWRIVATGLCFVIFSVGALVLSYLLIPLANLPRGGAESKRLRTRWLIHKTMRFFTRLMSVLGLIEFATSDAEKVLSLARGKIVIANHPSLIDVVVLISIMPHADCIVKRELLENPFIKGVLRAAGYINNGGDVDRLISACQQSLNSGYSLIIFPEGTRTTPSKEMILQRGASNIALRCKVDLVPVLISCVPTTLTKDEKWCSIPSRKVKFTLQVGTPIETASFAGGEHSVAIQARHLTEHILSHYQKIREREIYDRA